MHGCASVGSEDWTRVPVQCPVCAWVCYLRRRYLQHGSTWVHKETPFCFSLHSRPTDTSNKQIPNVQCLGYFFKPSFILFSLPEPSPFWPHLCLKTFFFGSAKLKAGSRSFSGPLPVHVLINSILIKSAARLVWKEPLTPDICSDPSSSFPSWGLIVQEEASLT